MKYKDEALPKLKELAEYLKVSEQAVKQMRKDRRLLMLLGLKFKNSIDTKDKEV